MTHSVEVTAESLYEAIGLAHRTLKVWSLHHALFSVKVRVPGTRHEIFGGEVCGVAGSEREESAGRGLKVRLRERGC